MSDVVDCSKILDQIQQQCRLEGRQPTGKDYIGVISFLQQTNAHLQQANVQLLHNNSHFQHDNTCLLLKNNQLIEANGILEVKCTHLLEDTKISQEILLSKHLEVEEHKKAIAQLREEIKKLSATINGLKEEALDSAKNMEDVINTNSGLLNQISSLKSALSEKDKQIAALLEQHNQKNKESKSLLGDQEQYQCELRTYREAMREPALTSISTDSLSSPMSQLLMTETTDDKYSFSDGKLRSDSEVRIFKRKIASANVADSLSNLHLQQKDSSEMHAGNHDDHSERKQLYISNDSKCDHLDEEQQAMIGKILQTTAKARLQCKMKAGRLHCNSTNLYICLKCGVTCCHERLYEHHSKGHTIFMKMKSKKIWCFSCKCDPLPSNSVTSLNKEKSLKTHEKLKGRKQHCNHREEIKRRSSCHYRNQRPRSASDLWSPSKAAEVAATWQLPPQNSPSVVHTLTDSVTSAKSYSATGKTSSDRQTLNSPSIMSSATVTCNDNLCSSYTSSPAIAQDQMFSSDVPASNISPISIAHSNISTVTSDSLPILTIPTMKKIDAPPIVVRKPQIGGKPTISNGTSNAKLSGKSSNLNTEILKTPINPTTKSIDTTPTTAIVPVMRNSHNNTLNTNNRKYLTTSSMARSQMADNNASTNSTSSASETESLKRNTSRSSHKRSPSFDIHDSTATKPVTLSVSENKNPLPADTYTSSMDSLRRRSRSFDSQILHGLPPFKGLINNGLTCFFNAAVQGLSRIKQFNGLLTKLWKSSDHVLVDLKKPEGCIEVIIQMVKDGEVSRHLSETIDNIRKPPVTRYKTYYDPSALFSSIQAKYSNSFRQYRQGDAHELMRCILDAVRMEEIEKVKRGIKQGYTGSENGDADTLPNGEDKMHCKAALRGAHKVRTYIDQVIGGELLSVVVCDECKHKVELIEPFLDISLPIPDKNTISDYTNFRSMALYAQKPTLEECFEEYTSEDILDNDNKFICSNCSGGDEIQLRKARKQLQLQTLPKVFIIHLKRFSIDHIVTKNSTHVKYRSDIDVKPYCAKNIDEKQSTQYSLFAVVQHIGSLNFGHYTAYIKMDDTGLWYKADDSLVSEVQESEALRQEAYLLFYQQRS